MTALTEYQRLESAGVFRASAQEQRRDVFVSVGDATLVIYDAGDRPLAHWSLPALERVNPGRMPALYRPGPDAPEELEIADGLMVEAIERVRTVIDRRRPRRGRLRLLLLGSGLAAVLALTVFWLPDALIAHTAGVVPQVKRAEIGERLLAQIRRVAGRPCSTAAGTRALARLYARVLDDRPGRIVVLADGIAEAAHLPGGLILLNRALVEDFEDPDAAAGYVLAESLRAVQTDPMLGLLQEAGPFVSFRMLTTGDLPEAILEGHAETRLTAPPAPLPDEALLDAFRAARLASSPYAYARDISGETTLALIEADPARGGDTEPALPDGAWVSLQGICGE